MSVTREVILDLLPLYLAGEASPASKALVEEYLKSDAELAGQIRTRWAEGLSTAIPSPLPPDLELRTLHRTRRLLGLQRWLFGLAIACTAVAFSLRFSIRDGEAPSVGFFMLEHPAEFALLLAAGASLWIAYFGVRRRTRIGVR